MYIKKKRGAIPLFLTLIAATVFILTAVFDNVYNPILAQKAPKEAENTPSFRGPEKEITSEPVIRKQSATPLQTGTPEIQAPMLEAQPIKQRTAIQNSDSIENYSNFHNTLVDSLMADGYDDAFSRNLAYKIKENLENHRTSQEALVETIKEELGPHATKEEIEKVRQAVVESVSKIANE